MVVPPVLVNCFSQIQLYPNRSGAASLSTYFVIAFFGFFDLQGSGGGMNNFKKKEEL